jgi:beta-galactosidase
VEVVRRGPFVFVVNRTDTEASVPVTGTDLLTGSPTDGVAKVAPGGVAVVRADVDLGN